MGGSKSKQKFEKSGGYPTQSTGSYPTQQQPPQQPPQQFQQPPQQQQYPPLQTHQQPYQPQYQQQQAPYQQQQPYQQQPPAPYPTKQDPYAPPPYQQQQQPYAPPPGPPQQQFHTGGVAYQPAPAQFQPGQTVVVNNGFDNGARFTNGQASIPPPPPGVLPNAAQVAQMQGANVAVSQEKTSKLKGDMGGGVTFW